MSRAFHHRHSGNRASFKKRIVETVFVVVDIAGNPLEQFATMDEAREAVETVYPGRRIFPIAYTNRNIEWREF